MEEILEDVDGIIVNIRVRNFFCHDHLEINFNNNVNFIVGRNGSGKSAVLTALVVGLGARASATNRGNSLNSFVKQGANSATVEIKLKNSSEKAYKPEIYGDFITVVRNITASGSSTYKVKSASGEIISTKHEEVHAIVLAHDIQVDNPICVLNQDEARSFHASDAKKKYALFRKATNLEQTENNYNKAVENCDKAKGTWKRKKEAFGDLEKELRKLELCYEHLQSREESEARRLELQNEFFWSEVVGLEQEAAKMQASYDKHDRRIQMLREKLVSMERNFGDNVGNITALKQMLQEKTAERNQLEQEMSTLGEETREAQTEWRSVQHRLNKHQELVRRENRKVNDLEKEIANINTGEAAARRAEVEGEEQKAAEAAAAARARYDTTQNDAAQAQQNEQRAAAAADDAAARLQRQQDKLRNLKMQLRELESRGNDSLAVYGNKMVELKQKIQEAANRKLFSQMPRGPVGSYLKVKDKKWASSLEHIIGGNMKTFCVNTAEDSRLLFKIMGQVFGAAPKPGVTCSKFLAQQHNVSRNRVRAGQYVSALDSLDVADPVIANYLIDNVGVESILLVPDHDSAVRLSDNVENVPQNCSKIVTLDGTEYHPAPNYRSYGGAGRPSRFLQVSTAERKRQVQQEIQQAESEVKAAETASRLAVREAEEATAVKRDTARSLHALLRDRHDKEAALQRAQDALNMLQAPHQQVLVEELEITKEKLRSLNAELSAAAEKDSTYKAKLDSIEAKIKNVKLLKSKVTNKISKLNEEIDQEQMKQDRGESEKQTYAKRVKEDMVKLSAFKGSLDTKKTLAEEKAAAALELGPRIDNPRDHAVVAQELKKLEVKLNSMRTDGLSKEQITTKLLDVQKKHRTTRNMLDRLNVVIKELKQTSERHLNHCRNVQHFIGQGVQYNFQSILTLRGYSGRMEIDNARGVLEMWCSGREASGKRIAATTSSLSGGERSYSTVAFIMALWECVELPFYFMDEFDVFMDNVNRKIVMELLVDHALKNSNRQFVFLTPQDASSVTAGPNITIHRMADPRSD